MFIHVSHYFHCHDFSHMVQSIHYCSHTEMNLSSRTNNEDKQKLTAGRRARSAAILTGLTAI